MAKHKKWLSVGLGSIGLLVVAGGFGYRWWLQSLPALDGEYKLAKLSAPASVDTDPHGIPFINERDTVRVRIHARRRRQFGQFVFTVQSRQ